MTGPMSGLMVGIDDYGGGIPALDACVADAKAVEEVLSKDGFGQAAFSVQRLHGVDMASGANAVAMREALGFSVSNAAGHNYVFFFSGHGNVDPIFGLELVCQDGTVLAFSEVMTALNGANFAQATVILDCCFAGAGGGLPGAEQFSLLRDNVALIAAAGRAQVAEEGRELGVFTELLIEGLKGGAADPTGKVFVPRLFNYVLSSLPQNRQQSVLRVSVQVQHTLRQCKPQIPEDDLVILERVFATRDEYKLKPDDVPTEGRQRERQKRLASLRRLRHAALIESDDERDLSEQAADETRVRLTPLGRYVRRLRLNRAL